MKKVILTYFIFFGLQLFLGLYLTYAKFENQFWIPSIIIIYSLLLVIAIGIMYILFIEYRNKLNDKLRDTQIKQENTYHHRFDVLYKRFIWIYLGLFILPISMILYIEYAPKKIYTVSDFEQIAYNPDGNYKIMKDLDFKSRKKETEFYSFCSDSFYFNGTLDGNHKTITNVDQVLFHCTLEDSVIKDLTITFVNIKGRYANYTGTIADDHHGLIDNVHVRGHVSGFLNTGGLVGFTQGKIQNSSFVGGVDGYHRVGGLAGESSSYLGNGIYDSYAVVHGIVIGQTEVGGLVGRNNSVIKRSYVKGFVLGTGHYAVGGLVGNSFGSIHDSYTKTSVLGASSETGGLAGHGGGSIYHSFSLGTTTGDQEVGGLAGKGMSLESSFAYGNVKSENNLGFGLVYLDSERQEQTVTNSYVYKGQDIEGRSELSEFDQVTYEQLSDSNWYRNILNLDEEIWDLSPVEEGYFPILKSIENQDLIKIEQ